MNAADNGMKVYRGDPLSFRERSRDKRTRERPRIHLLAAYAFTFINSFIHQSFVESSPWARPHPSCWGKNLPSERLCLCETYILWKVVDKVKRLADVLLGEKVEETAQTKALGQASAQLPE